MNSKEGALTKLFINSEQNSYYIKPTKKDTDEFNYDRFDVITLSGLLGTIKALPSLLWKPDPRISDKDLTNLIWNTSASKILSQNFESINLSKYSTYSTVNGCYTYGTTANFDYKSSSNLKFKNIIVNNSDETKTFYPTDGGFWELAKLYLLKNMINETVVKNHVGEMHTSVELVGYSIKEHFNENHPIYLLLKPHVRFINALATFLIDITPNHGEVPFDLNLLSIGNINLDGQKILAKRDFLSLDYLPNSGYIQMLKAYLPAIQKVVVHVLDKYCDVINYKNNAIHQWYNSLSKYFSLTKLTEHNFKSNITNLLVNTIFVATFLHSGDHFIGAYVQKPGTFIFRIREKFSDKINFSNVEWKVDILQKYVFQNGFSNRAPKTNMLQLSYGDLVEKHVQQNFLDEIILITKNYPQMDLKHISACIDN